MNILALDTATEYCSVALLVGEHCHERHVLAPRQHGDLVLPMIDALLIEAGIARNQLDGIALGRGPGAFTGVRLGVALGQGLALALNLPVVTLSSLAALALEAPPVANAILAVMDARMGEVYAAGFTRDARWGLRVISPEVVIRPERLSLPDGHLWHVVGSGWGAYPEALGQCLGALPQSAQAQVYPRAAHVAQLALPRFRAGQGVPAAQALPVYLRDKVAQTLAERGKPVPRDLPPERAPGA